MFLQRTQCKQFIARYIGWKSDSLNQEKLKEKLTRLFWSLFTSHCFVKLLLQVLINGHLLIFHLTLFFHGYLGVTEGTINLDMLTISLLWKAFAKLCFVFVFFVWKLCFEFFVLLKCKKVFARVLEFSLFLSPKWCILLM